jgi:hypothetical protein
MVCEALYNDVQMYLDTGNILLIIRYANFVKVKQDSN